MKIPYRTVVLVLFFAVLPFSHDVYAQSRKVMKAERKAERIKERQERASEKARKKELKHRFEIQTPKTQERMKETRKQADEYNDRNHESFLKRLFKRKRPKSL